MDRLQLTFLAVIVAQAAHSVEEYRGRLYDVFPLNVLILAFGAWCWFWPVRRHWRSAVGLAWVWAVVEVLNGIGHSAWSLMRGGYTPGVATAPALLALALTLGAQLVNATRPDAAGPSRTEGA